YYDWVQSFGTGSTRGNINAKTYGNMPITLPPRDIQDKIVDVLKSLDDKIEVNRRINDNLEQQAQALFKSWFVDFEPFRDQPFVESELGMIPEGWRVGTIGELLEIKYGKDHKKLSDGEIPVYGSGGLMRKCECALYDGESVLIPRKGTLNNVMYVNEAFWTVDTMFYSIPIIDNVVLFTYLYLSGKDLASMNSGSAVPSMTTEILNNMLIVIPTEMVIRDFNITVTSIYSRIKHGNEESRRLAQLRDTLLPRLMSGELRVNEIENEI
ncbi:MAG: restriction endonuclease subunit S, partial [Prevotella sp.]|nr:restriction endonuclease subunit S [Prevotella sp.]